jgi:alkylresorcinol/alkylpyrone synthase
MHQPAQLLSVATAVPPYCIKQRDAAAAAFVGFAERYPDFERLASVFANSGIRQRYSVRPIEWFFDVHGWQQRNDAFLDGACRLFMDAAAKALDQAGVTTGEVDTIVSVSSTGIATPSLEARVADQMGFRADVERVPVFGLGCSGGVAGLSIAARLAQSRPGSVVLLVAVEICTLAFRMDELTKANIVATALFGDGASACVLKAGAEGIARIEMSGQNKWPDTLDIMGWSVDSEGLGVIFDRSIPPFAKANMRPAVDTMLAKSSLEISDIDRFVCHPGGAKVVEALEHAFSLGQGTLNHERTVLADYGNMSAPTVFFVLERAVASGLPSRSLLTSMGPGFSANVVLLKLAA